MRFDGFDRRALEMLAEIPTWDSERYAISRSALVDGLLTPGSHLVSEVADKLDARLTVARNSVSPLLLVTQRCPSRSAEQYAIRLLSSGTGWMAKRTLGCPSSS